MRIVKVGVLAPTNKGIPLGVQGESCATEVEFDVRPWFREYPSGTVSAVAKREGDPAPYPLSLDVADGTAVWLVSDTDTAKAGEGAVELTMTSGGTRVRSLTFKTAVTASLTDAPVDDDAWYGWLDKAVVKVDDTVQSAQRKMAEVDEEWTGLKADVTTKVEECSEVAEQAAKDAHHAKVDAQATAKALESAEGSVAKAEAAAKRAVDAMLDADDSAVEASNSALSVGRSAEAAAKSAQEAKDAAGKAVGDASASLEGYVDAAAKSAGNAATSATAAASSASAAAESAEHATAQKVAAENAKDAAEVFKAGAEAAKGEAAKSATVASDSAAAAAKSAEDAAASAASAINVIAPKSVGVAAVAEGYKAIAVGDASSASGQGSVASGFKSSSSGFESVAIGDSTDASGYSAVAVGLTASAKYAGSVALGSKSVTSKIDELSIGAPSTNDRVEYVREITHVSKPTESTSAATKAYVDESIENIRTTIVSPLKAQVKGAIGIELGLAFGSEAFGRDYGIAIGDNARATGHSSLAIGSYASALGRNSAAIGDGATTSSDNVVAIGRADKTRELMFLSDPTASSSAATKGYVDNLLASANMVRGSSSITVADGTAKVNPDIFGDGLAVTDGQVSVNMDFVGEHLAGDALYYDQTDGLMLKVGQGLRIQNDELDLDQAGLPLASAGVRGTVRVGGGLSIDADGVLSATGGASGGYAALANVTAKTTERVGGIAGGEDDVQTTTVTAPVFEKDGALYAWGPSVARTVRTTYTAGTRVHVEMDFAVGQTRLNQSLLKLALVSFGEGFQYVPTTTHNVGDVVYLTVEVTVDKDVKAGSTMLVKLI